MTGPDLNALVNCDIVHNVCPEPDARLFPQGIKTEWIKPGRAFWHWWSGTAGDFNGVALERQKWWADKAGEAGFEYILVDAGWERSWGRDGNDKWAGLKELCDYAGKRGVRVWVWKRWAPGRTEGIEMTGLNDAETRREFFKQVSTAGAAGIKIDFMDSESKDRIDFYANTLKDAAEHKLMINFHGANKPTGESRTFPNEMTREGVRGLEYLMDWNRGPKPADQYAILPFTRFLAGHGDFTPCTFQQKMLYGTTFTLQLATAIIYTSPVMHWADKADLYLESPLAEVVRQIPSVWDETLVLPGSRIGELAAFARRKGNDWYIGIVNGTQDRKVYDIDLSFLGDGEYRAIMVFDRMDNLPWMRMKRTSLGKSNGINAEIAAGGGFAAWLAR
jgi:alpha-glucosidase